MKFTEKWKRFLTLRRHSNEGFTLVELIVVIAILAILAGVAVPAYSGYITKANMQADISLVSELKDAAIMGILYEYDHEFAGPVVVKLSATEKPVVVTDNLDDKALVEGFIEAVYGENWEDLCMLSYGSWTVNASDVFASYSQSSLKGKEVKLLETTSTMSQNLAGFLNQGNKHMPDQIKSVMNEYGYTDTSDTTTFANAAVLALAKDFSTKTNAEGVTMQSAVADVLASGNHDNLLSTVGQFYTGEDDEQMAELATAAALYAYATAFSEYADNAGYPAAKLEMEALNESLANTAGKSSGDLLAEVFDTFGRIGMAAMNDGTYDDYFGEGGQGSIDANALMAVMGAVNESADALAANLSSENCYSEAKALVDGYMTAGEVLDSTYPAGVIIGADGSVVSYLGGIG